MIFPQRVAADAYPMALSAPVFDRKRQFGVAVLLPIEIQITVLD
jgi:hypothetical protein